MSAFLYFEREKTNVILTSNAMSIDNICDAAFTDDSAGHEHLIQFMMANEADKLTRNEIILMMNSFPHVLQNAQSTHWPIVVVADELILEKSKQKKPKRR